MNTTIRRRAERIVVGVDGSVASHATVRWAIDHARSGDTVTPRPRLAAIAGHDRDGLVDPGNDTGARHFVDRELARVGALPRDLDVTLTGEVIHGNTAHT